MPKSFSQEQRNIINQKLVNACKECWQRYGYAKTGIRDIAQIANISVGAFYQFYPSKELLFITVADEYQKEMESILHDKMQEYSGKRGVAEGLKTLAATLSDMPWLTSMWDEWETIIQRLPSDYVEQDFRKDTIRMDELISKYKLIPKEPLDSVTRVIDILLSSMLALDFATNGTKEAVSFIVDAAINDLFE